MDANQHRLIAQGLARLVNGRLIPVIRGGDPSADSPFPTIPADLAALSAEELDAFIADAQASVAEVAADPKAFVNEAWPAATLLDAARAQVEAIEAAKAELASRVSDEDLSAQFADLHNAVTAEAEGDEEEKPDEEDEAEEKPEEGGEGEAAAAEAVVVAAATTKPPARQALPRPARSRAAAPLGEKEQSFSLVASIGGHGYDIGEQIPDPFSLARMMESRRGQFGEIPEGTSGEKITIARVDYSAGYREHGRTIGGEQFAAEGAIAAATDQRLIRENMRKRQALPEKDALTASGGLCAPVTPYYQLAMVSVAERPVRAALPAFNADRGGIRYARPATLASITTGVGVITAAQDAAGGTTGTKTCQVIDCPPFQETDVAAIFHCLQFGNLGARTFPERVAQWNNLVLASHARLAESTLLTTIDAASTAVTAGSIGLGASADLPSQILMAGAAMRNRHRMDPETVLRVMLPAWVRELIVSDVYRSQFQRWDMTVERFVQILRAGNVEPTFYLDGAAAANQVFATQSAGVMLGFPSTVRWYLFPEGSFLYVDGGTLELGLVRDSVLNKTNDFQIFGETFENVAYVGVESLAITSTLCPSGITAGTHNVLCPIDYALAS